MTALDIYCIAIGGTGMAPLACLLQEQGHRVRGVDGPLYPPMSTLLEAAGIEPLVGFDPAHLELGPTPDLVVIGNAVPRHNPEAALVEARGIPRCSMPEALARFCLEGRRPLVVAGTHGKTTTTALAAWVWSAAGADPGFLIGGVPADLGRSFASGRGPRFIIEGDEYNAAYFDRGPKFLHYRPQTLILTSVEYDHADLYPSPQALLDAYAALLRQLPPDGLLAACGDEPAVRELAGEARCAVRFYGHGAGNEVRPLAPPRPGPGGMSWTIEDPGGGGVVEVELGLWGEHNVSNALGVWTAARAGIGGSRGELEIAAVAGAMRRFTGVKRRQEELGAPRGIRVVDDFAHHPTAVGKTLESLRQRYPGRRLIALFEPRSLTAGRSFFFDAYVDAFARADQVVFAPIFHAGRLDEEQRLDLDELVAALSRRGVPAHAAADLDAVLAAAIAGARPGDVVITMSSGSFAGVPQRLVTALSD